MSKSPWEFAEENDLEGCITCIEECSKKNPKIWVTDIFLVKTIRQLQKNCLDKQRVREAIIIAKSKLKPDKSNEHFSPEMCFKLLKEVLGL